MLAAAKSRHSNPDLVFETTQSVRVVDHLAVHRPYEIAKKTRVLMAPDSTSMIDTNKDKGACHFKVLTDCNSPNGCAGAPFTVSPDGLLSASQGLGCVCAFVCVRLCVCVCVCVCVCLCMCVCVCG